jgi:hypothetical protein
MGSVSNAGNLVTTTPSIATATSVTVAAAKPFRNFLMIQNNSAANIALSFSGATLTGIAPTSTNLCYVLPNTAGSNVVRFDGNCIPAGAITAYQTSGGTINTLVVIEG